MLDIYIGPLSRYYARDWKTKMQQYCEQQGIPYRQVMPDQIDESQKLLPAEYEIWISNWANSLANDINPRMKVPLIPWPENYSDPYETYQLTWPAHSALRLWSAYLDCPDLRQDSPNLEDIENDKAIQKVKDPQFASSYRQLASSVELWLPGEVAAIIGAPSPTENVLMTSSNAALLKEFNKLNEASWKMTADQISVLVKGGAPASKASLNDLAKYGCAVMLESAAYSRANNLPIKLDY